MKMTTYLVKRHGSNAANQSMTPVMVLGCIEAVSQDAAKEAASVTNTIYNNQYLSAKPISKCSKAELEEARELEIMQAYARG